MYDYIQGNSVNKNVQEQLRLCHFSIVCETYMVMYHVNSIVCETYMVMYHVNIIVCETYMVMYHVNIIVCETYMVMYHVNTHVQYKTAYVLQPYLKQHNFTIQYKNLIVFRDNLLKIIKIHQLIP